MLSRFINWFQINYLEQYVMSNHPKSIADVERLEKQYIRRLICG